MPRFEIISRAAFDAVARLRPGRPVSSQAKLLMELEPGRVVILDHGKLHCTPRWRSLHERSGNACGVSAIARKVGKDRNLGVVLKHLPDGRVLVALYKDHGKAQMMNALLPLPPEDEVRRLRLQESIDQDSKAEPLVKQNPLKQRVLEPVVPLRLRCQVCEHEWDLPWERGMLADALLSRMKAYLICPRCGNKSRARKKTILLVPQKEAENV